MQRRHLMQSGAWLLATGASVTLTWFGVHTVVSGTAYDPPPALPVSDHLDSPSPPRASSTQRPKPPESPTPSPSPSERTASASRPAEKPSDSAGPGSTRPGTPHPPSPPTTAPAPSGTVTGTAVAGGRVVFDVGSYSAELVSATPEPGWNMQVWKTSTWIRVTFSNAQNSSTVLCRWEEPPPRIETFEN